MINWPDTPTPGQVFNPGTGPIYTWDGVAWNLTPVKVATARARNRIANPSMQVSQENASNTVTANSTYAADQWLLGVSGIVGAMQRQTVSVTPDGTTQAVAILATTAKPSLAATDSLSMQTNIEGFDVADLQWGTANAQQTVLRFNAYAVVAGTYAFSVCNSAADRSYLASFDMPASQWKTITLVIPGDVTGTWVKDNGLGARLRWGYATGSTYVGVAGWQAGNLIAPPGCINAAAAINQTLFITDVGFYADPDKTGLAPAWEPPEYATVLTKCERYWQYFTGMVIAEYCNAGNNAYEGIALRTNMRTTPTGVIASFGTVANATNIVIGGLSSTTLEVAVQIVATGNGSISSVAVNVNARM